MLRLLTELWLFIEPKNKESAWLIKVINFHFLPFACDDQNMFNTDDD